MPVPPGALGDLELGPVVDVPDGTVIAFGQSHVVGPDDRLPPASLWTSPDGVTWTRGADSDAFVSVREGWNRVPLDLLRTDAGYVAVGMSQFDDASQADAAAWSSPDGATWGPALVDEGSGRTMDEVVATDHGLVAFGDRRYDFHGGFGDGSAIWTSPDGRSWTRIADDDAPPLGVRLRDVTPFGSGWIATATAEFGSGEDRLLRKPVSDGVWRSDDAIHWTPIRNTPLKLGPLVAGPDGLVALGRQEGPGGGDDVPVAWRSTDGAVWTKTVLPRPAGLPVGTTFDARFLVRAPGGWLAAGDRDGGDAGSVVWSSRDGVSWTGLDHGPWGEARIVRMMPAAGGIIVVGERLGEDGLGVPSTWLVRG
ncbi:MAG TPA: hypothetical protein VFI34_12760 [Candidatus Limnocylindrales bacterium]|nr:hypothetical protein [Candidatus Limnocylindrales bacterium]